MALSGLKQKCKCDIFLVTSCNKIRVSYERRRVRLLPRLTADCYNKLMLMHNNYLGCWHPIDVLNEQAYLITAITVYLLYTAVQWRSKEDGGKWGHAPRGAGLKSASEHFLQLSDQSRRKNAYFLEKICKNRLSVRGQAPESPFAFGGPRPLRCHSRLVLQLCSVRF